MSPPSRYDRGEQLHRVELQARDVDIMLSIHRHRWLRVDHVRALHFPKAGERATRERLRRLWLAGLLDRAFLTVAVDDVGPRTAYAGSAVYCLARRGAEIVAKQLGLSPKDVPHTLRENHRGYRAMCHNLVATDLFVALEARAGEDASAPQVTIERESTFWPKLRAGLLTEPTKQAFVVPDGAFTLTPTPREGGEGQPQPPTVFYFEIVRSDPRGGATRFVAKLATYALRNRDGFFRRVWNHSRLRAVLILTPTPDRAENLRRLAASSLERGRSLFWFGSYEGEDQDGRKRTTLTPETIFAPRFLDLDGGLHALAEGLTLNDDAHAREAHAGQGPGLT